MHCAERRVYNGDTGAAHVRGMAARACEACVCMPTMQGIAQDKVSRTRYRVPGIGYDTRHPVSPCAFTIQSHFDDGFAHASIMCVCGVCVHAYNARYRTGLR